MNKNKLNKSNYVILYRIQVMQHAVDLVRDNLVLKILQVKE